MDRNFAAAAPLALLALAATLAAGCLAATVPRARPAVEVDGLVEIDAPARAALGAAEAEWLEAVHDEIHGDWSMDVIPGLITNDLRYYDLRLEATVEITLEPSGKITEVRLARASGIEYLDRRAEALFANLGALPPPPEVLLSDDEVVRLRWRLARDQRGCAPGGAAVVRIVDPLDVAVGRLLRTGRHVRAAARLIEAVDEGTVPEPLARALTSDVLDATADREPDLDVRFTAVFALAENGDRRAVPKLRQLLKFANPESARAAARLATLGAREAIADLEAAVARNHPALNAAAIDALRALGRPDAADVLVPALRSREPRARLAALGGLAAAPREGYVPAVVALLRDSQPEVRLEAVRLLGQIGGPAVIRPLAGHLAHPRAADRAAAAAALAATGTRSLAVRYAVVPLLLDGAEEVRAAAMAALIPIAPDAWVNEIYRGFKEAGPAVLLAAVPALAADGGPDAAATLERIVRARPEAGLRAAAAAALARRGAPAATARTGVDGAGPAPSLRQIIAAGGLRRLARAAHEPRGTGATAARATPTPAALAGAHPAG